MANAVDGAAHGGIVGTLGGPADLAEPKRRESAALLRVGAVRRLELSDLQRAGHQLASTVTGSPSSTAASASAGASSFVSLGPCDPSTSPTESPRSAATSSGRRRFSRAVIVAFTRLIGFCDPSDF